jgi:hypothetical protein
MASIHKVPVVLSCACLLGLGQSNATLAIENSLATDEIKAEKMLKGKGAFLASSNKMQTHRGGSIRWRARCYA